MDYIVNFFFDTTDQLTKANLFADSNADGLADTPLSPADTVDGSDIKNLWEAGLLLWKTDSSARTIYANVNGSSAMTLFTKANLTPTLRSLLNSDVSARTAANNQKVAENVIDYVRGTDLPTLVLPGETIYYRNRTTGIDLTKNGTVTDAGEAPKVWKLGDIVNSTPRVVSWIPLNAYQTTYRDTTYSSFISSSTYKNRGMIFAGANDGMLHAFKLGTLDLSVSGTVKAKLCEDTNGNGKCESGESDKSHLGTEQWGFIPKSALPYLQYYGSKDYCHLYYVDATPYVFDASIEAIGDHPTDYWTQTKTVDSWRTVLIGGMRLGGACSEPSYCTVGGAICSVDADCASGTCAKAPNTVGAPAPGLGYSSYFALDVTDPATPKLMWEFTDPNLGFASSGPAIMRINARNVSGSLSKPDKTKDGKWFVVLASGPTGPVGNSQFKGFSNQNLRLFVLDLKTGNLLRTINTGIANAFGGSMNNAGMDYDFDYQDDALYLGYTKAEDAMPSSTTIWNKGGVLRLITREDLSGTDTSPTATGSNSTALNPANWLLTKVVDDIGPVTSSIAHLAHYPTGSNIPDKGYLYFGSGRYFFPLDDSNTQQTLYGVVEPCLSKIKKITTMTSDVCDDNGGTPVTCTTTLGVKNPPAKDMFSPASCLENSSTTAPAQAPNGWYINLDPTAGTMFNERVITDPLAAPNGAVFFTSFAPNTNICTYGGSSYLWAVKYDTGGGIGGALAGVGLLQVSTGAIEEIKLQDDFTQRGGRRTESIDGVPPSGDGIKLILPPKPINKVLHIKKR